MQVLEDGSTGVWFLAQADGRSMEQAGVCVRLCPYLWGVAPAEGTGNGSLGPALAPVQSYRTAPRAKQEYLLIRHMANPRGRGAWQLPEFPV